MLMVLDSVAVCFFRGKKTVFEQFVLSFRPIVGINGSMILFITTHRCTKISIQRYLTDISSKHYTVLWWNNTINKQVINIPPCMDHGHERILINTEIQYSPAVYSTHLRYTQPRLC